MARGGRNVIRVHGVEQCIQALMAFGAGIRRRVVLQAVRAAASPVNKSAKRIAAFTGESGLYGRSIGIKAVGYKRNGFVVAIVGARRGFKQAVVAKRGWLAGRTRHGPGGLSDPTKYAHLAEGVTKPAKAHTIMIKTGRGVRVIRHPGVKAPSPGMRAAWTSTKGAAMNVLLTKLRQGVVREATKAAMKRAAKGTA
jgi:hypothetical protein